MTSPNNAHPAGPSEFEALLAHYDYPLEKDWIAEAPASPRDSAKLLVYTRATDTTSFDTFAHLDTHIPKGALLVFNDTKVLPARVYGHLPTGGKVEVLCISLNGPERTMEALMNRRLEVGVVLTINEKATLTVEAVHEKTYTLRANTDVRKILTSHGTTPIPPYLKHTPLTETQLRKEYQTIFAREEGSSAAPTASLHFTKGLMHKLSEAAVEPVYVTLHVGLGTFAPLTPKAVEDGVLHEEAFTIPLEAANAIRSAKAEGRPIIAVGTTAARALESAAQMILRPNNSNSITGVTTIFIRPGYQFKVIDGLITNFHVPRSSLMMLVATLTGREKLLELYTTAHENGFKFLSFGDGMLIL